MYAVRVLQLATDLNGRQALFEAKGRTLLSQGWKVLMTNDAATEDAPPDDLEGAAELDRVGGGLAAPVLPHHRAYGSVPRRFT